MRKHRRLGVAIGFLLFFVLCAFALLSPWGGKWISGITGIEDDLTEKTVENLNEEIAIPGITVELDGRNVELSGEVPAGTAVGAIQDVVLDEDGVRTVDSEGITFAAPPPPPPTSTSSAPTSSAPTSTSAAPTSTSAAPTSAGTRTGAHGHG